MKKLNLLFIIVALSIGMALSTSAEKDEDEFDDEDSEEIRIKEDDDDDDDDEKEEVIIDPHSDIDTLPVNNLNEASLLESPVTNKNETSGAIDMPALQNNLSQSKPPAIEPVQENVETDKDGDGILDKEDKYPNYDDFAYRIIDDNKNGIADDLELFKEEIMKQILQFNQEGN